MELKYIEAFLKIVETGSFSSASEKLYISQPTISVRIQQLEKELNRPLFNRIEGKKVKLTPYGEKLLPYLEEAYSLIEKGCETIQDEELERKRVIISCPNHMGAEIMPEILSALYTDFPGIDFSINIHMNNMFHNIISGIRNHEVDIGFMYMAPEKVEQFKDFNTVHISDQRNVLVASPDHPLAKRNNVSISSLRNERIYIYDRHLLSSRMIDDFFKKHHLPTYRKEEINHLAWIKRLVEKGFGVSFLQQIMVKKEIETGSLVEVPLEAAPPMTSIVLIFRSDLQEKIKARMTDITWKLYNK
ncbi:LysR family transcriptional regulator [Neobacillus sp. Marseille-QA0830]